MLRFNKKRPDRGYAYVAASRVRQADRLILMGPVRRTDWLPVGEGNSAQQVYPSSLSDSDASDADMARESKAESQDQANLTLRHEDEAEGQSSDDQADLEHLACAEDSVASRQGRVSDLVSNTLSSLARRENKQRLLAFASPTTLPQAVKFDTQRGDAAVAEEESATLSSDFEA